MIKQTLILFSLGFFIISCDNSKKQSDSPLKIGTVLDISDYDLIDVNDGKIEVESTVGKGTLFKIYLRNLIPTNNKRIPKSN